ncbi:MAG: peptide deformylase [Flavobacteriales bacterium]|nr:peptide deformylase [Flavobacteriales bacterium]
MILPIRAYGDAVLRKKCKVIDSGYPDLDQLIANMFETMDASNGVGLAAPQIGLDVRIFVIDSQAMYDDPSKGIRKAFLNAQMVEEFEKEWPYEEGCLSIPHIREDVSRNGHIRLKYQDEDFKWHEEVFDEMTARVIQHEYDHIEGILFIDHLSPLKRRLLKGKLNDISKGKVKVDYRMRFPKS